MSLKSAFSAFRHSVRGKLTAVVLLTTTIAVLVAGGAMLQYDLRVYRSSWVSDLGTQADILALSTAPALIFDDHEAALRNLNALRARPEVSAAALYLPDGSLYAQYTRSGAGPPQRLPAQAPTAARITGERVVLIQPIIQKSERIGSIYLAARYDERARIDAYLGIFALVLALAVAVALVLSTALHRVITAPLEAMAEVARKVVQHADYSPRAQATKDPEIAVVVEAFNRMLAEVQSRTEAMREADRRKDEFLATLAHELRNPLAPIRNAVKLLEVAGTDERDRQWGQGVIARQVQQMALLLDDLLDVSRITRGRLELKKGHVELATLVAAAIETARPLIDGKHHTLVTTLPPEPIELEVDPLRLSQALSNLLTNAAKYTDEGGRITLTASRVEEGLLIRVEDTGIGLSAAAIPKLFEMFSQVQSTKDRAEGGLGIGLALVRGLIELHGGTVEAHSPGPGLGSVFSLHLPSSCLTPSEAHRAERLATPEPLHRPRCKVLVLDDNRDSADSLALLLEVSGYEVRVANSGPQALELSRRFEPAVLLLDIGLPGISGHEVARRIRQQPWGRHALLIAVTGWGQQEDRERTRAAGIDYHLTKPVDPNQLLQILEAFCERLRSPPDAYRSSQTAERMP